MRKIAGMVDSMNLWTAAGVLLGIVGVLLTIWSILYARKQSRLLSNARRDEIVSLWAHLDRIRTLISGYESIMKTNNSSEEQAIGLKRLRILSQMYRGLCDEYVRVAEMIVKKTPIVSMSQIEELSKRNVLRSDWQKQQFVNLISHNVMTRT